MTLPDSVGPSTGTSRYLARLMPIVDTLRGYRRADVQADLVAALTVAVVALPQAMAYAVIAGVHPRYGLYAAIIPVVVASLWGSSRYLIAGPTNAIAMLLASSLAGVSFAGNLVPHLPEPLKMSIIFGVAILAGVMQVAMGLARIGSLTHFVSHSVVVGFTAGAGMLIAAGQLKNLLGIAIPPATDFIRILGGTLSRLGQTNLYALGVGLLAMAVALGLGRVHRRMPAAFLAVVSAAGVVQLLGLEAHGVRLVGEVPREFPPFSLPPFPDDLAIRAVFMPALAIAILGTVEALSIAKTLAGARGESIDGSQECIAQGLANMSAGFFSGIPGSGSFTRSAVNYLAGARTRMAGVFTGVSTLLALLLAAPWARYIPLPALAGILLLISWGMIDKKGIRLSLRATRGDRWVLLATCAATLLLDLEKAVFLGVLLSIGMFLRKVSHPQVTRLPCDDPQLVRLGGGVCCPNLSVYQIEGALFFGAVDELEAKLYSIEDFGHKAVILHLKHVACIDATGIHAFEQFLVKCRARAVNLIISGLRDDVRRVFEDSGLATKLGGLNLTTTLAEALELAYGLYLKDKNCGYCRICNPEERMNALAQHLAPLPRMADVTSKGGHG